MRKRLAPITAARGWCSPITTPTSWCQSAPVGNYGSGQPQWANFPLSGAWLCHHLWEHYVFGGDVAWLRELRLADHGWRGQVPSGSVIEDGQGHLVTCPSTSAENVFVTEAGLAAQVSMATTFDMTIICEHFDNCLAAAEVLGIEDELIRQMRIAWAAGSTRSRSAARASFRNGIVIGRARTRTTATSQP